MFNAATRLLFAPGPRQRVFRHQTVEELLNSHDMRRAKSLGAPAFCLCFSANTGIGIFIALNGVKFDTHTHTQFITPGGGAERATIASY